MEIRFCKTTDLVTFVDNLSDSLYEVLEQREKDTVVLCIRCTRWPEMVGQTYIVVNSMQITEFNK